ncbi:MAG: hypothetical protein CMN28_10585 [Salinisphaeraceae bacterium]|nr:hypothetical protein [Salinisphaeraceae bacterium]
MASGVAVASDGNIVTNSLYSGAGTADALTTSGGAGNFNLEGQSRALVGDANAAGADTLTSSIPGSDSLSTGGASDGSTAGVEDAVLFGLTEGSEVTTDATVEGSETTTDAIIDGQDVLFESANRGSEGASMPIGELGDDVAAELRAGQQEFASAVNDGQDEFAAAVSGSSNADSNGTARANAQASDDEGNRSETSASASEDEADVDSDNQAEDSGSFSLSSLDSGL